MPSTLWIRCVPGHSSICAFKTQPRALLRLWVMPHLAVICTAKASDIFGRGVGRQDAYRPAAHSQTLSSLLLPDHSPSQPCRTYTRDALA
jgi:hypothetical protein